VARLNESMSDGMILLIPIPKKVIDGRELPAAEKLEKALTEERRKRKKDVKQCMADAGILLI
jgi:hypothetical protein